MENFNCCEYSTEQKTEGRWLFLRIFFVIFYIAFAVTYFAVIYITRIFPVGALIPLALWILVFFTWRYTKPDYKYEISSGFMRFFVVYRKKQKEKLKIKISTADAIIPKSLFDEKEKEFALQRIMFVTA